MTHGFIQVPPDSTGKKLFTHQHTIDGGPNQVQVMHLASADNPDNVQHVDGYGAAKVTFAEGAPSLTAFANVRVAQDNLIAKYDNIYSAGSDFSNVLAVSGTVTHDPNTSSAVLAVTNASGSSVKRTTDRYHYYMPGTANLVTQTLALGDSGKVGNTRRWGYYDDTNGLYWGLTDTTVSVCIRSSTSGSPVDTVIAKANWNGDKLDGLGISGMTLDLTKANLYWIDYAWLGVGAVRFGVFAPDGSRIVCHTFQNPNNNLYPYMQTGMLPIRYENYNTAGTSGTSELRQICAAVYIEGNSTYPYIKLADISCTGREVTTNTPILSVRSKLLLGTKVNRASIIPSRLSVFVVGGSVKVTLMVKVTSITDATWAVPGMASIEGDAAGTAAVGGFARATVYLDAGAHTIETSDWYQIWDDGLHLQADGTTQLIASVVCTKLSGTTVTMDATINYKELR